MVFVLLDSKTISGWSEVTATSCGKTSFLLRSTLNSQSEAFCKEEGGFLTTVPVFKSNQIKSLLLSHHHSTSALVSEILMSVLQTVQKNNRQFTYGQTVQKNNKQFTYGQTVQKNNKQFTYGQTVQKNCTGAFTVLQTVQKKQQQFTYGQTVQKKNNSNLHMDRQCKKQQQFTYGQYIFTDCTEDNVQNTHTYTQYA